MSVEFYDSWEDGTFDKWNTVIGIPFEIVTSPTYHGTKAIQSKLNSGEIYHNLEPSDIKWFKFWFYIKPNPNNPPSGAGSAILFMAALTDYYTIDLYVVTGGSPSPRLRLYGWDGDWADGTHQLPINQWICIAVRVEANKADGKHQVFINGEFDCEISQDTSGLNFYRAVLQAIQWTFGMDCRTVIDKYGYWDTDVGPDPDYEFEEVAICPINPYKLYIDDVQRDYIKIHYVKNHPSEDPDTFEITVNHDVGELVNYFDSVEVKKNGVTEFYGFVEDINPQKGQDGLEYVISGRCWKVLLWKKFTERFQESREVGPEDFEGNVETGFFGSIYPHELFRFLLRCPISDHPKGKIRHKIGWGIASDWWKCCANVTADTFYPDWVMLRYTGLSWRGRASTANLHYTNLICDSFDSTYVDWTENGSSPYLHIDSDADNIATGTPPTHRKEGYFGFDDLIGTAERIYGIKLYIKSNIQGYTSKIAVHLNDGTSDYNLGYLTVYPYGYGYTEFNCITVLDTPTKVNNAKIYFELESGYHAMVKVIYAYFHVEYSTTVDDDISQKINDWFVINLGADYDMVTAMLIECRNNPNMYARNYKIQYCTISDCCAEGDNDGFWSDFDDDDSPINVVDNTARDILHSWKPQDNVHGIRIKLTADADPSWEISQIYIWQADNSKYRLLNE